MRRALVAMLALAACREPMTAGQAANEANRLWADRCSTCHGPAGEGDGPQARLLETQPRRLSDPDWQASVTDEHLRQVIVQGGQAVGKSPLMAPNPDLADKPEVVDALVNRIRGL